MFPAPAVCALGSETTSSADRRQVSVLFADISGFTSLSQRIDPEDVRDVMNACFDVVGAIIDERGGTVDKYIGDCVMALFGAPKALENSARQALNSAIEIRNGIERLNGELDLPEPIGVHIGVNTGLVVAGHLGHDKKHDYTVISPAVNLAARLYDAATCGQIFVGRSTYRYTEREFDFRELAPLDLKGIDDPVPAYELLSTEERRHKVRPGETSGDMSSVLVGREAELSALTRVFEALPDGRGSVVTIAGENGIGKSRLLAEALRSEAAGSLRVVEGRCISTGATIPFHPFGDLLASWAGISERDDDATAMQALRRATGELDLPRVDETVAVLANLLGLDAGDAEKAAIEEVTGEALEHLVHGTVREFIGRLARGQPLVLVFEDLHWADQSSLALLEAVLPLAGDARVAFILVCRPEYDSTSERILKHVSEQLAPAGEVMRLEPLSENLCDSLIENLFATDDLPVALRNLIKRDTGGNPFYIEEVIRALLEHGALRHEGGKLVSTTLLPSVELPATISEVIMTRVDGLDGPSRRLLRVAAVIGRRFECRILERVLFDAEDLDALLDDLSRRQFLARATTHRTTNRKLLTFEGEQEYLFRHAYVQETVYLSLVKREKRKLHADCAAAIEQAYSERPQDAYGMLAYHYTRGNDAEKAEEFLLKAGAEAARTAASVEALHFFREAHRLYLETHGDDADDKKLAMLEKNIATALVNTGNLVESLDHFDAALRLYGQRVPRSNTARWVKVVGDMSAVLFHLYFGSRRGSPRRDHSEEHDMFSCFYNRCRAVNATDPERGFFDNLAAMRYLSHVDTRTVDRACGMYAATAAFFSFAGLSFGVSRRFLEVAEGLSRCDQAEEADEAGKADEAGQAGKADKAGQALDRFQLLAMGIVVDFHAGDWSHDRDMSADLLEQGLRYGLLWDADTYLGMRCERNLKQGHFAGAEADLERLSELHQVFGYEFARSNELAMRGFLALERRDLDRAGEYLREYYGARHEDTLRILALSGLARVHAYQGDLDAASEDLTEAERLASRSGRLPPFYDSSYRTARLLVGVARIEAGGDTSIARRVRASAKHALGAARRMAREAPEAHRLAAKTEWLLGKHAAAEKAWREAIAVCERLGARPELARVWVDIATALEQRAPDATFDDAGADQWRERARGLFDEVGIAPELERCAAVGDPPSSKRLSA